MHCCSKEHLTKFNSKKKETKEKPAFYTHLVTSHVGGPANKTFAELFQIETLKEYMKPITRNAEEGTFIDTHKGEIIIKKKVNGIIHP